MKKITLLLSILLSFQTVFAATTVDSSTLSVAEETTSLDELAEEESSAPEAELPSEELSEDVPEEVQEEVSSEEPLEEAQPAESISEELPILTEETVKAEAVGVASPAMKSGTYILHVKSNDAAVVSVAGTSTASKANVEIKSGVAVAAKPMTVSALGGGLFVISPTCSSLVLDVSGGKAVTGTNVQQYKRNNTKAQSWKIIPATDGYYKIASALDNKLVLGISGSNAQIQTDSGKDTQLFRFEVSDAKRTVPNGCYTFQSALDKKMVVDIAGGKRADKTNVQLYKSNNTNAQKFHLTYLGKGLYKAISARSNKAIDVSGGKKKNGTNIWQYRWNNTAAQKWYLEEQGTTGTFLFHSALGNFALDVKAGKKVNKTNIQLYKINKTAAQRFYMSATTAKAEKFYKIGINAGHQRKGNAATEPIGPGATQKKAKCTSGTYGKWSKLNEYELNLTVAKLLKTELESRGYEVYMIRTSHDVNISNAERAQMANKAGCDILVNIHANGLDNTSVRGAMVYQPSGSNKFLKSATVKSAQKLASNLLTAECKATGLPNKGLLTGDDMASINWASMPSVIVEMGFMSNKTDDLYMGSSAGQKAIAKGLANGIDAYFG